MGFDQLSSGHLQEGVYIADKVLFAMSMVLCLVVLALAGWIYRVKQARPNLRRVSFRLMLWTMGFQVGYNVFRELLLADTAISETVLDAPVACSTLSTLFFQTLCTTNCLITCIALNLALITCLGLNPIQLGLERWYIAGSLFFGLGLPIIPAALGHFGPDPIYGNCYLSVADEGLRLKVVLGELVIWQFLCCIVASLAVCAAIIQLVRQSRTTKRAMRTTMHISDSPDVEASPAKPADKRADLLALPALSPILGSPDPLLGDENPYDTAPEAGYPRKSRWRIFNRFSTRDEYGQLHDKVFGIALRISLYPIALIIINIVQSVGDVYFAYTIGDKETTRGEVVLYVFYRATYAGRGIILALLCLLCDPCLKRGLSIAWRETFQPQRKAVEHDLPPVNIGHNDDGDKDQTPMSLADFMNISVLNKAYAVPETRRASAQSLDISAALQRLPFYPSNLHPLDAVRNIRSARAGGTRDEGIARSTSSISADRASTGSYTRSFAGVASASLPSEMTDDVDVDLRLSYSPSRSRFTPHPATSDTGDIADELEPVIAPAVYEETEEGIVLQPIHATPRPSLVSVPGSRQVERELISKLDKLAQVEESAGPSRPRADTAVLSRSGSKVKEEPRKISWGSIPTAPTPARMLARQKRLAAAATAAEKRSREGEEKEKRRLAELELQL